MKLHYLERDLAKIDKNLAAFHFQKIIKGIYKGELLERKRAEILWDVLEYLRNKWKRGRKPIEYHYWLREAIISQVENSDTIISLRKEIEEIILQYWQRQKLGFDATQEILEKSTSRRNRREAWTKILSLAKLIYEPFKSLVNKRNEGAQKWGFADYSELVLNLNDLQKKGIINLCHQLIRKTDDEYFRNLDESRRKIGLSVIAPWDISYLFFSLYKQRDDFPIDLEPDDFINLFFQRLGWYWKKMPIKIKYHDIPYGGLCFNFILDRKSILLLNPKKQRNFNFYIILAHEMTHAFQNVFVKEGISYINILGEPSFIKEGTAEFIGYLVLDGDVLRNLFNVKQQNLNDVYQSLMQRRIIWLRRQAVDVLFEIYFYQAGFEKAQDIYDKLLYKYLGVSLSSHNIGVADIIFCSHPMYLYNYILAENIKLGIERKLKGMGIPFLSQNTGQWLKSHFLSTSGKVSWIQKVKHIWSNIDLKQILGRFSYRGCYVIPNSWEI